MERSSSLTQLNRGIHGLAKVSAHTIAALGIAALATTSAFAANNCQQIQANIAKNGSFIYHYRDPAQPDLDLYRRYVSSSLECAADDEAVYTNFPQIADCPVQHCIQMYGRSGS